MPGLGDATAKVLNPINEYIKPYSIGDTPMTDLLKPDMKAVIWLAVGAFVVPYVLKLIK